eukprot:SAG22_NODE_1049_length_5844_cov_2.122520_7_plen_166_part_00
MQGWGEYAQYQQPMMMMPQSPPVSPGVSPFNSPSQQPMMMMPQSPPVSPGVSPFNSPSQHRQSWPAMASYGGGYAGYGMMPEQGHGGYPGYGNFMDEMHGDDMMHGGGGGGGMAPQQQQQQFLPWEALQGRVKSFCQTRQGARAVAAHVGDEAIRGEIFAELAGR